MVWLRLKGSRVVYCSLQVDNLWPEVAAFSSLITVDRDVMASSSVDDDLYVRHRCMKNKSKLANFLR